MEVIIIILSYFFTSEISAYTLKQIGGINELVEKVGFDQDGNIYAVTTNNGYSNFRLHAISTTHEVLWTIDLPDYVRFVSEMLVTSQGDIYFDFSGYSGRTAAVLRSGSTIVQVIDDIIFQFLLLDTNDNLLFCKEDGIYMFRPDSLTSVPIKNLEGYRNPMTGTPVIDKSGNIYFRVYKTEYYNPSVALLTKEALQEEIPYATFINATDNSNQFVLDLTVDEENNLWITVSDYTSYEGIIKKLVNGTLETVLTDTDRPYNKMVSSKGKIFIVTADSVTNSIYYITLDGEIMVISELQNETASSYSTDGVADSDGYAYFYNSFNEFSASLGRMIVIQPNEMNSVPIPLEDPDIAIDSVKLDFNEDAWILGKFGLYHLRKSDFILDILENPNESCRFFEDVNVNFVTKKIYVACANGLFVVENI